MTIYIAFLRGINVGKKNRMKMADLRQRFENIGLHDVQTYIQSGNVIFESEEHEDELRNRIESEIDATFGAKIPVILRNSEELKALIRKCPFTDDQVRKAERSAVGESLYVSLLLHEPALEKVDDLHDYLFEDELYFLIGRDIYLLFGTSIRNSPLASKVDKLGVPSTVRNWKTLCKLVSLIDER
ncbi:DUF1697 domain-containing protein [Radiobacillus sp. PE A8.2]|uniref:DUF1697 domain-containing protein n=1 Tax=Radiobacillus sp. PE A8.2 TaxID=3380349 RepID=UPI00388E6FA5